MAPLNEPFDVAEQLAFQQRGGQGAAIAGQQRMVLAAAEAVDGPDEHLLARAAFADQQHRAVGGGHAPGQGENPLHRPALADDALETLVDFQFLPQDDVFADQPRVFPGLLDDHLQLVGREGLADVVVRPLLHGLDGRFDGGMAGDDDDFRGNAGRLDLPEDLQAADARHHQVDQHDVELAGQGRLQARPRASWKYCTSCPSASKRPLAAQADHRLVVDDENPQGRFRASWPFRHCHAFSRCR